MIRSLNAMLFQHRQQSASITKAVDARARAQPSASPISTPPESPPSDDLATGLWSCQWPTASQAAAAAAGWEAVDTVASAADFEDCCQFEFDDHEAWVSVSISDSDSDGDGQRERAHGLSGFVAVAQTQVAGATAIILSEPAADPPVIPSTPKPVAADASNPDQAPLKELSAESTPPASSALSTAEEEPHPRSNTEASESPSPPVNGKAAERKSAQKVPRAGKKAAVEAAPAEAASESGSAADTTATQCVPTTAAEEAPRPWLVKKQKPNAPCACGSGKKFKKCCRNAERS